MNEILQVATFAGQIILESGGETYRVEDTILRICKTFGAEQAESFVTPTGIMSSICHKGEIYSLTKRVVSRTVDLNKIDKVNDLSRNILSRNLTVSQFKEELIKINEGEKIFIYGDIILFGFWCWLMCNPFWWHNKRYVFSLSYRTIN